MTVAALGTSALASAASAASVNVTVPSQVKKGKAYSIQVQGSYKPSELTGRAYLISIIQFSPKPCKATAQQENRAGRFLQYYFTTKAHPQRVGVFVPKAFKETDSFTAGDVSTRRVCAYLYPKFIRAGDTTAPIARADKRYAVTRK